MMDLGIIIAIVGVGITIVASIFSMMFWVRNESNEIRKDQKEDRKDLLELTRAIQIEIKDFHYRLLEIEKRRLR